VEIGCEVRWGCFKIESLKWNSFPADIIQPLKDVEWVLKGNRSILFQGFQAVPTSFGKIDAISSTASTITL